MRDRPASGESRLKRRCSELTNRRTINGAAGDEAERQINDSRIVVTICNLEIHRGCIRDGCDGDGGKGDREVPGLHHPRRFSRK